MTPEERAALIVPAGATHVVTARHTIGLSGGHEGAVALRDAIATAIRDHEQATIERCAAVCDAHGKELLDVDLCEADDADEIEEIHGRVGTLTHVAERIRSLAAQRRTNSESQDTKGEKGT